MVRETNVLVNIYTLCSDVQRNANEFRKDVADVPLDRPYQERPVHGQYEERIDDLISFSTGTQMQGKYGHDGFIYRRKW
jgi:hypothetical protein